MTLMGYKAHATQQSYDGGVDVWAINDGKKVIIQCKRYSNKPVGRSVVDELAGVKRG